MGLINNNYQSPTIIPLPEFANPDDYITRIECGKRNTALISKHGEIWITGNFKIEKVQKNSYLNSKE